MLSRRAYLKEPGKFEIREEDLHPGAEHVLIKVAACGLCNWELNHWHGLIGTYPQIVGHEGSGTIVEVGPNVKEFKVGDNVSGLAGGFADYAVVPAKQIYKLADHINPQYALTEPLKCVVTVCRAASPAAGDVGVVVGCGPMGLWCIQAIACNHISALIAIDIDEKHLELAKAFGATHILNPKEGNVEERIAEITNGRMADFIIEGTGNVNVLGQAARYIKKTGRGRLLAMSSYDKPAINFNFQPFLERGIELIFPHPSYSLDEFEDLYRAVDLLNKGVFEVERLITHTFKLADIQTAFETLDNKPEGYIKGIVIP